MQLLLALLSTATVFGAPSVFAPTPHAVRYVDHELYVDGSPFYIQGLCYSPVPIGETVRFAPFGDYFTAEYAYIWKRDLPLIKEMGVNTIRIYGWNTVHNVTHFEFLDEVHRYGLKVVVTFFVGRKKDKPPVYIDTPELAQVPITNFTREVALYGDHPALLMWSFGNELNGPWNGFLEQIADLHDCSYTDYGHCWNKDTLDSGCLEDVECLYKGFFGWLNEAAVAAKSVATRPVISGLADLDQIVSSNNHQVVGKLQLYGHYAPDLDMWAIQLYQGERFHKFLKHYRENTRGPHFKPLGVTEYGVDAYNDPCGWPERRGQNICKNMVGDPEGGVEKKSDGSFIGCADSHHACAKPGSEIQEEWDVKLTQELYDARIRPSQRTPPPTAKPDCLGPYSGECEIRMGWMAANWQEIPLADDPCVWQKYLFDEDGWCPDPFAEGTDEEEGVVGGGFIMAWIDERWKGNIPTQAYCKEPCDPSNVAACHARAGDFEPGGAARCTHGSFNVRAHWECDHDTYFHGLCGYGFGSMPDMYMNEEWFGFNVPKACGYFVPNSEGNPQQFGLDSVTPRRVMKGLQEIWDPSKFAQDQPFQPSTCEQLLPCWQCIQDHRSDPDLDERPAFLHACLTECDITAHPPTPPPTFVDIPTPPTHAPTTSAPTPTGPPTPPPPTQTTTPSKAPTTTDAPTRPTQSPTKTMPPSTQTPTGPPTARLPGSEEVSFRITQLPANTDRTSFRHRFRAELALVFEMNITRVLEVYLVDDSHDRQGTAMYVDVYFSAPAKGELPSTDEFIQELQQEMDAMQLDPDRGCEGQACVTYTGIMQGDSFTSFENVDPFYGAVQDGDKQRNTSPPTAHSPKKGVDAGVVVFVVLLILALPFCAFALWKFHQHRIKHKFVIMEEDELLEEAYVPPPSQGI